MEMKIKGRAIFIGIVMVVCLLGIIGFPRNFQELKDNVRSRIRMGLDLKGGTHLVLQVQVEDAVNITADQVLERLRDELRQKTFPTQTFRKPMTHKFSLPNTGLSSRAFPRKRAPICRP